MLQVLWHTYHQHWIPFGHHCCVCVCGPVTSHKNILNKINPGILSYLPWKNFCSGRESSGTSSLMFTEVGFEVLRKSATLAHRTSTPYFHQFQALKEAKKSSELFLRYSTYLFLRFFIKLGISTFSRSIKSPIPYSGPSCIAPAMVKMWLTLWKELRLVMTGSRKLRH